MTRQPIPAGIHDLAPATYHADPCPEASLSASLARLMIDATPLHAWTASARLNPDFEPEHADHFDIGSAAHEMLTGKGAGIAVIDADSYRTKAAQAARDDARDGGQSPLLAWQYEKVAEMIRLARVQMRAHGIGDPFDGGENEVAMIWEAGGVWNRAMPDCLHRVGRVIYDYKTTAGIAEPERWVRGAMEYGIDLRAALYIDGARSLLGGDWRYRFVVQEKAPPHCLSVIELAGEALEIGGRKLARARDMWRHCLDTERWPGFSAEIAVVSPPAFMADRWLDREMRENDYRTRTGRDALAACLDFQSPLGE